jgi:DNA-binding CsgD family transcriptional regulator
MRQVVASLPSEFAVLSAGADELSQEQPFGVVAQLGVTTSGGSFAAGLDLLRLVSDRRDRRPVLVAVEDLHWADVASREALATTVRRLDAEPVAVLVTSRPGSGGQGWDRLIGDESRCHTVRLGPVTEEQVGQWAGRLGIDLSAAQASRLHRHAGGHPLYVKTLLTELTSDQLTSATDELPAPRSLAAATTAVLAEMPAPATDLVSALAVLGQRAPLPVVARIADVTEPAAALETLLPTGVVRWWPGRENTPIDFVHPLYRLAVYDSLSPTRRRTLHRAAAGALGRRAGWPHRIAAADGVDDALADELEQGATAESDRGGVGLAAKYLLWAAPLTSDRSVADARLQRGARLLLADGQWDRVDAMVSDLRDTEQTPLKDLLLGSHALENGDVAAAQRLLTRAASSTDPMVSADANIRLSSIYVLHGDARLQAQTAAAALSVVTEDDDVARAAWTSLASAESAMHGAPAGLAVLSTRLPALVTDVSGADAELLMVRGVLKMYATQTRAGVADLRTAVHLSRQGSAHRHLPAAHVYLGRGLFILGDWDEALVHARAARAIAAEDRYRWMRGRPEFVLGTVAASRGQWSDAEAHLAAVEQTIGDGPDRAWSELLARVHRSALCRARGDAAGVVAALEPLASDQRIVISRMAMITWWPILIEGLIELRETGRAAAELERLSGHTRATGIDIAGQIAGLRARAAAASGDPDEAARLFETALTSIRPDDGLIDRALIRHHYGRLLHALGNRRAAVAQLRDAHELFAGVGAEPFRAAVAEDLDACGIRTATAHSPLAFTEREQDVVALVRKGMTNKEVAGEMYVSEKAVEYHLRNVYGKLGISSRRELRALT